MTTSICMAVYMYSNCWFGNWWMLYPTVNSAPLARRMERAPLLYSLRYITYTPPFLLYLSIL